MLISGHDLHTFAWCIDHICCPIIVIYRLGEGHCGLLFFVAKPHPFTENAFFFELKRPFKDRVFDLFYNIHCGGHRNTKRISHGQRRTEQAIQMLHLITWEFVHQPAFRIFAKRDDLGNRIGYLLLANYCFKFAISNYCRNPAVIRIKRL